MRSDFEKVSNVLRVEEQKKLERERQLLSSVRESFQNSAQVFFEETNSSSIRQPQQQQQLLTKELSNISSFWKIEPVRLFTGGHLTWDAIYRLKHFVTGKYLTVKVLLVNIHSMPARVRPHTPSLPLSLPFSQVLL